MLGGVSWFRIEWGWSHVGGIIYKRLFVSLLNRDGDVTLSRIIRCQYGKWALYRLPTIFANFAAWRKGLALAWRCRPPFSNFIFTCRVLCKRRKLGFTWWRHKAESNFLPLMTTPLLKCSAIWWHIWLCSWPAFQFLGFKGSVPNKWWKWGLSHHRWKRKNNFLRVH